MYTSINNNSSPLKVFQQIGRSVRRSLNPEQILQAAVEQIGWHFEVDRCIALLFDENEHTLDVKAQYQRDPLKAIETQKYQLLSSSEWYRLLVGGRPLPLAEIQSVGMQTSSLPELDQFIKDTDSKSVVAFPLMYQGTLLGCLSVHQCREESQITDDLFELGEAFAEELAGVLRQANLLQEKTIDGRVFASALLPLVVLEKGSFKIIQTNAAAAQLLDGNENDLKGLPFLELFAHSDAQRLKDSAGQLSPKHPVTYIDGLLAPSADGQTVMLDAAMSTIDKEESESGGQDIVLAMFPTAEHRAHSGPAASAREGNNGKAEELAGSLSRQLTWERVTRQIISKLHANLDRDSVLQSAADLVGRALRASACLIIRTDSPATAIVTHEYADPNLSPLGLGRSGQMSTGVISCFKQRTVVINDLSNQNRPQGLSKEDVNSLLDNGVGAVLSTPIAQHGSMYGVIVVESNDARTWSAQETEMIETIAQQAAIALANAQAYAQVKDQLFNMNLISNLTQQLTTALDQAGRNARNERPPELAPTETPVTPLSSRELEVLKLIASGLANREIAQKLFLTESTVELHASRIRKKLKLKSRTALVKFACDNHLV